MLVVNQGDEITLSTGVVLKVRAVPAWKMNDLTKLERPKPPEIEVDGRKMENPDDPDYHAAIKKYEEEVSNKMTDYMIVFGTDVVSIPENLPKQEDKEWKKKVIWSGTPISDDPVDVYLAWVKYVAGTQISDIRKISQEVGRRSGVNEVDVKTAADNFRGAGKPPTNS